MNRIDRIRAWVFILLILNIHVDMIY